MKSLCAITVLALSMVSMPAFPWQGQSFASSGLSGFAAADPAADAPDAQLYADGMRAIHENRWSDAVKTFDRVAAQNSDHAAGALYWKAYALNKQGHGDKALETCDVLRTHFANSSWKDDCGALEVEIRSAKGQTVHPKPGESDNVKLLALAKLMEKDPKKGKEELEAVLSGDVSEQMREGALYILGQAEPESSNPEIVRVSYLEGDVRIARGGEERDAKKAWDVAVMNLPLAVGDSLATGADGRVEIEFEDASTAYLAPNSVVTFNELRSTRNVPFSNIGLVSGTMTLYLDSLVPGEMLVLHSPSNTLMTRYPQKSDLRVTSFADAIAVTPLNSGVMRVGEDSQQLSAGQTLVFGADHHLQPASGQHGGDFAAWDTWAADRHASRVSAEKAVMQEAHLSTPIPGLAEMKDKGKFFECPPYGMCWQPDAPQAHAQLVSGPQQPTPDPPHNALKSNAAFQPVSGSVGMGYVPCLSGALFNYYPATMVSPSARWQFEGGYLFNPYDWAVCHSGSWIYQNNTNSYAWVVGSGRKLHYQPPVHWVRIGHTTAFVPVHPRDTKGEAPINRAHAFVPSHEKAAFGVQSVKVDSGTSINVLKSPPHEFRPGGIRPVLTVAQPPQMTTRTFSGVSKPAIPIRLDPSRGFLTSHQPGLAGGNTRVFAPIARPAGGGMGSVAVSGGGASGGARSGAVSSSASSSTSTTSSSPISASSTSSSGGGARSTAAPSSSGPAK